MSYTCAKDVKLLCGLSDTDISDGYLESLIKKATARLNSDISTTVVLEEVEYIDEYRSNDINGSNTTFYTKNSFKYHLGDLNDDGTLDENDVEVWYYNPTTNERTKTTVSSVTTYGEIEVASAPSSSYQVKVTYRYQPVSIYPTVDALVHDAVGYLTGSYAEMHIAAEDFDSVTIGRMRYKKSSSFVTSVGGFSGTAAKYYNEYLALVRRIDYLGTQAVRRPVSYQSIDIEAMDVI